MPENLVPLGRSFALNGNGSVTNLAWSPAGMVKLRRALAAEPFDVVHVHEPIAPFIGPDTCSWQGAPVVGTFHAYSTNPITNHMGNVAGVRRKLNQLHARIAVSEAAAWTGRRWFGGEYTVIPNGVDLAAPPSEPKTSSAELRVLFVGRPEERKGLPILLRAFEALVEHVPARLTVIGADDEALARYLPDPETAGRIDALGRVPEEELWARLHSADVLCAPSLAGESFGMILTEAFAAGTPVVASRIAGYSDVVTDGVDGVLVPPADAQALAEELQRLHHEPERRERMGVEARRSAERYAWPRVAERGRRRLRARARGARARGRARPHRAPPRSATRRRRPEHPPAAPALAGSRPGRLRPPPQAPSRRPRRRRDRRRRADRDGSEEDRRRQRLRERRALGPLLGPVRGRADVLLDVPARRVLVLDRPLGAAEAAAAPPRRHLGDDDRRPHVRDSARPPRRARARHGARPPQRRAHARDVPGPARDARLAVRAQHRRARRCSAGSSSARPTSSTPTPRSYSSLRRRR